MHVHPSTGWLLAAAFLCLSSLGCGSATSKPPGEEASPGKAHPGYSTRARSLAADTWSPTGSMASGRILHTSVLLADGRVLTTGGYNRSTELYNPATGTWSRAADTLNTHRAATTTLLPNGQVLLAGRGGAEWDSGISSQLYDTARGTWTATGALGTPRVYHTATLLPDGRVLVTGGADSEYGGAALASAEVYDVATGTWTPTGPMAVARRHHTATLLSDGKVLVIGGTSAGGQLQRTAEVYDAATGTWSPVGSLAVARASHSATLLPDGKVLVTGGGGSDWAGGCSVELFDPATGAWTRATSLATPRRFHSATLLPSGMVLVAGGFHEYTGILTATEVYEPSRGTWHPVGLLATGRYQHTATLLASGRVLVAGGFSNGDQASAELFSPPGAGEPEEPSEPAGTSLVLQVIDSAGNPVPGAAVATQQAVFPVDSAGHRLFEELPPGRFLARVDALGFTSATAVVDLEAGAHVSAQVKLMPLPAPIAFQAEQGGTLQTQQVRVSIPPAAVVDALGQPVTGTVQVTVAPLDPTSQLASMPGPLEGTAAATGQSVQLESFFMAEVSLWSNGSQVQLAPGKSATLEFVLPEALAGQFEPGDTVPAWWFDLDAGHWREEGTGTIQPSQSQPGKLVWRVQVNHFTWWNCDAPWTDKSCVNVLVVDENGVPVPGIPVNAEGVSYSGASRTAYTGTSGRACVELKRGNTADVYIGPRGAPATGSVRVTGTQTAAACGTGPCTELSFTLPEIICTPGAYRTCPYAGPAGTEGQGLCRASRQQCNALGTQWSACQGEVLPAAENCRSPFDDDCDGQVNENCVCSERQGMPCYGGPSATQGVGICHGGTIGCDPFGNVTCLGQQLPQRDACWTQTDENCDGQSPPCQNVPGWTWGGSMVRPRAHHTATRLLDGKVLVSGGYNGWYGYPMEAEVYDPATNTWSMTGSMAAPRWGHTATLLPNGKVLVLGGSGTSQAPNRAEVYNPATGTWSITGAMASPRESFTATLLPDGRVLVTGGTSFWSPVATAEVYNPATGTWSATGAMSTPRSGHTATLLPNGQVLVAGGHDFSDDISQAELYDPATGSWSVTGSMLSVRSEHTATRLSNGKVLVTGGFSFPAVPSEAEVYDPATGTWSATGFMSTARSNHTATRLPSGKVLVTGGYDPFALPSPQGYHLEETAEVYDPGLGTWSMIDSMGSRRAGHTATLLLDGKILVSGGTPSRSMFLPEAELYTP